MFPEVVDAVGQAGDAELMARLHDIEECRRSDSAEESLVLAELERRKAYRNDGHASMWGLLRTSVGWSDRECRERMRVARLVEAFPSAGEALHEAQVPVASVAEIARGFANPRCGGEIEFVIGTMLNTAQLVEFDDLKLLVRRWERRTDVDGAHKDAAANHEARNAHVVVAAGVGYAQGQWGEVDGLANREVFDRYVDAEWRTDWDQTREAHGDDACASLMPRTDAQRRADAMTRIFADAAARSPDAAAPEPLVNVHVDHATFEELMVEAQLFPERQVDPFEAYVPPETDRRCETDGGEPVDPRTVVQWALYGAVRFVIQNERGTPIRWGRKRRLFTGAARDAVMSLGWRCTHPGCRVRARRTHADHTIEYGRGGFTDPDNGNPRCLRHNLLKNRGYTVHRDRQGNWHTYRPDGTEIC
ncbi:MAG: hypothetical protein ACR2O6_06630 [Ilumatobacteraceae bacterium]